MNRASQSSPRVGRFGPRSLSFRVLVVVLVPMAAMQFLAWRDLRNERNESRSAAQVAALTRELHDAADLYAPAGTELSLMSATVQGEAKGLDRSTVDDASSNELSALLTSAQASTDDALATLTAEGINTDIRTMMNALRASFADGSLDAATIAQAWIDLGTKLHELTDSLSVKVRAAATTSSLLSINTESNQLVAVLGYANDEMWHTAQAGFSGAPATHVMHIHESGGSLMATLDQLENTISAPRQDELTSLRDSTAFNTYTSNLDAFTIAVALAADADHPTPTRVVDQPIDIQLVASTLAASAHRVDAVNGFVHQFFIEEVTRADADRVSAEHRSRVAAAIMISTLVVSLVLLILVMRSILRPLGRLMRQARKVRQGDLAIEEVKPTGPTDLRVVTRAFNDMVTSLQAYETQLDRLAQGDTKVDPTLPGPLGDTVRRSVGQLANLTAQLHASEAAAVRQARVDALTGLANRTAAMEQLAVIGLQARQTGQAGAIIFLDLDGFKSVNDTQGHAEGDRILAEIAERVRVACPHDVVARIGGDEFLVLIHDATNIEAVTSKAHALITVMSQPCIGTKGQLFALSASAGVALIEGDRDPLTCVAQADTAVYHAKERGRGRVEVFDAQLAAVIEERAEMALTMRQGLADRQFFLCLQPVIDVATSRPVGAEVLLRWNRPGIGEVGPSEFIPVAEKTGVIVDLESWVLEEAVAILRDWRIDPVTAQMRLAVNVSGRHVVEGNLALLMETLCANAKVDPGLIDLEITETHLMSDVFRSIVVVDDLRSQGFNVSIDDFGTGYSSMSYLHRLTVDALKIDQVFVAGICNDGLDRTIVELLLRLGESLGLKVVAEGVDSEDKLLLLKELGCPWAQGFHIAKPMSIDDATRWLKQQHSLASFMA